MCYKSTSGLEGGGEEELHHYMIFVTLKENSSLVHETIVPINLIKLTKINTNTASV